MLRDYFGVYLMDAQILLLFFSTHALHHRPDGRDDNKTKLLRIYRCGKADHRKCCVYPISMKSRKRCIGKIPERHPQLPPRPQGAYATRQPSLVLDALRVFQCPSDRKVHRAVEFRLHEDGKSFSAYASRSLASSHGFIRYFVEVNGDE